MDQEERRRDDTVDDDVRPTDAELEEMIPAEDFFTPATFSLLEKARGRPKAVQTKERLSMRIDRDVLEAFRRSGPGWQTRINEVLRDAAKRGAGKPIEQKKRA